MKTKKLKLVAVLGIMLLSMLVFNINIVNATENETGTINDTNLTTENNESDKQKLEQILNKLGFVKNDKRKLCL